MTAFPTNPRWVVLSDEAQALEDIYFFLPAMAALRKEGTRVERFETRRWKFSPKLAQARLAGACLLIARSLGREWIEMLEAHREQHGRICYLVDYLYPPDPPSAQQGISTPEAGTETEAAQLQQRLITLADEVVVISEQLETALGVMLREHEATTEVVPGIRTRR